MREVLINDAQISLQKTITWIKKKVKKEGMNGQSLQRCNLLLSKAEGKTWTPIPKYWVSCMLNDGDCGLANWNNKNL